MQSTKREQAIIYQVDPSAEPVLRVKVGETFRVETNDHMNQELYNMCKTQGKNHVTFTREEFSPIRMTPMQANPCIGPIYIEGAEPGDVLAIHIDDIIPGEQGTCALLEHMGVLMGRIDWPEVQGNQVWLFDNKPGPSGTTSDGTAEVEIDGRKFSWKLNPHIGTILTAPSKGRGMPETLTTQGSWGGNVDVRDVCKGHTIYLNCYNEGGLLYLGDVHAAQGDSELIGAAIETWADVILTVDVIKNKKVPGVMRIETPTSIIQIDSNTHVGSHKDALNAAYIGLMKWMMEDYGFTQAQAYVHMSCNSNVIGHVYQFVDGFFVCGVEIAKESLKQ